MSSTHTRLLSHIVFATKNRTQSIPPSMKHQLYNFISGVLSRLDCHAIAINGTRDHVHILVGYGPTICVADIVREIKKTSCRMIREQAKTAVFQWQAGYSAFSVGPSGIDAVVAYIENQEEHHRKKPFIDELRELLARAKVDYNADYLE